MLFGLFPSTNQQREMRRKKLNIRLARLKTKDAYYTNLFQSVTTISGAWAIHHADLKADIAGTEKELEQL